MRLIMEKMVLVNKMEGVVEQAVETVVSEKNKEFCTCDRCRKDVIALALNSLPPRYVVTEIGDAVTNVDLDSFQGKANIIMAVYKAIDVVNSHPRHS
ncbi:MAG: late competence development ComFB family protein [Candidatus Rifleibacteriota bacterium]